MNQSEQRAELVKILDEWESNLSDMINLWASVSALRQALTAPDEGACAKALALLYKSLDPQDQAWYRYAHDHDTHVKLMAICNAALASAPALQGTVAGFDEWWSSHPEYDLEIKHAGSSGKSIARRALAASHPQPPGDEVVRALKSIKSLAESGWDQWTRDFGVVNVCSTDNIIEIVDAALARHAAPAVEATCKCVSDPHHDGCMNPSCDPETHRMDFLMHKNCPNCGKRIEVISTPPTGGAKP